jgi:hypothetical protein
LRVLVTVHELHKRGYQRLRIMPGLSPSGGYWRCNVTPISNILWSHGAIARDFPRCFANYTSGMDSIYFGWEDAGQDRARDLANKFIRRFPEIVEAGRGRDWEYVGWYLEMLATADQGHLPVSCADWHSEPNPRWLPTTAGFDSGVPVPPAGEAEP